MSSGCCLVVPEPQFFELHRGCKLAATGAPGNCWSRLKDPRVVMWKASTFRWQLSQQVCGVPILLPHNPRFGHPLTRLGLLFVTTNTHGPCWRVELFRTPGNHCCWPVGSLTVTVLVYTWKCGTNPNAIWVFSVREKAGIHLHIFCWS